MFGGIDIGLVSIIVLAFGALAGAAITTVVLIGKKISKVKAHKAEAKLRKENAKKYKNPNKIKALVKKYYKYQIRSKIPEKSLEAKVNYLTLKHAKAKKIVKAENKLNKIKSLSKQDNELSFSEKLTYGDNQENVVNLTSNRIISNSPSILKDYTLALESTYSNEHYANDFQNRKTSGGIFPMELIILNQDNNSYAYLSDVSSERYYEFAQRIFAKLYVDLDKPNNKESYKVRIVDNSVKTKHRSSQMDFLIADTDDCKKVLETVKQFSRGNFKGFNKNVKSFNFNQLVDVYKYEDKISQTKPNRLYYKNNSDNLTSEYLNNKFEYLVKKSDYQNKKTAPTVTSLIFNGAEMLRFSADNDELNFLMTPYVYAYGFIMAYERYKLSDGGTNMLSCITSTLDSKTLAVNNTSKVDLHDYYEIYNNYKSDKNFMTAINAIAKERNLNLDVENIPMPEHLKNKALYGQTNKIFSKNSIVTNRTELEKNFYNDIKQKASGEIIYDTELKNNAEGIYKVNLSMSHQSRLVQLDYFLQLLLEAYAIGDTENKVTKKFTPITLNVSLTSQNPSITLPENVTKTYKSLNELKQEIIAYAKTNLETTMDDSTFNEKVTSIKKDLYLDSSSTFIF